jgi:hypothetical protein
MTDISKEALVEIVKSLLPTEVRDVERVGVQPNDVIIFECAGHMTAATAQRIRQDGERIWPNNRIVVIDQGIKLKVLRERDLRTAPSIEQAAEMIRQAIRFAEQEGQGRADGIEEILDVLVERAKEEDA